MFKIILGSILYFICTLTAFGQLQSVNSDSTQSIQTNGTLERLLMGRDIDGLHMMHDIRLDSLFLLQQELNKKTHGISGYRVQMFRGNAQGESKKRAREIQGMVLSKYPDLDVDVFYQSPFWRIQVGKFRLRNEAMKMQSLLKQSFREIESDISIVPTIVDFPSKGKHLGLAQ